MRAKRLTDDPSTGPWVWDCDPDLGYWISRRHEYQIEQGLNIYAESNEDPVEICFRTAGSEAALRQKCAIYLTQSWFPIPNPTAQQPAYALDESSRAWKTFGRHPGFTAYWFFGYHSRDGNWLPNTAIAHMTDVYSNGLLTTVYFEDTGAGGDFNDLVIQIFSATRAGSAFAVPAAQKKISKKFEKDVLPRLIKQAEKDKPQKKENHLNQKSGAQNP